MAETYSAGVVTAYGAAVRGGYTGTYEQFCAEQASFAASARQVAEDRAAVEQLAETFEDQTVPAAVGQVNQAGAAQVQAVQDAGADEESDISAAGTTQVQAIQDAGSAQVTAVQDAGAAQVTAVQGAGTTQVAAVNTAGAAQVDAVEDKGEEVLASIPQDYSALSGEVDDLKSEIQHDIGFNENKFTFWENYIVSASNGTLYSNSQYIAMKEPIAVAPGDTVKFVNLPSGRGTSVVVFYSSVTDMGGELAADYINIPNSVQSAEITVPANTNYIRFTVGFTSATSASSVNPAEVYVNFSETTKEKISNLNSETQRLGNTLDELTSQIGSAENEDLFTAWDNYVVSVSNGTLYQNQSYICVKKAIPVKGGDVIYLYSLPTNRGTMSVVFYTDVTEMGGTVHSYVTYNSNGVSSYECAVPPGANYFRVTIGFGSPTPASTVEDSVFFVNYHTTFQDEHNPELNVLVFGDSISDTQDITIDSTTNTTTSYKEVYPNNWYEKDGITIWYQMWPSLIKRALNIKELRNYAKSGAHFYTSASPTDPRQKLLYQVQVAINDLPNPNGVFPTNSFNPDVVIVACGVNDGNVPSGAFDSTMAKTVMKAGNVGVDVEATMAAMDQNNPMDAMRYVLMLLKQTFPTALLLYVNPLQQAYGTNDARLTAREELGKMAAQYDFINLDGFGQFGVVRDFETQGQLGLLTKDGLHPNDKGQNLFARNIALAIRRYYLPLDKFNP